MSKNVVRAMILLAAALALAACEQTPQPLRPETDDDHGLVSPCGQEIPGLVFVTLADDVTLLEADVFARTQGPDYEYWSQGRVFMTGRLLQGDPFDLQKEIERFPLIYAMSYSWIDYPTTPQSAHLIFTEGVELDAALAFVAGYAQRLEITHTFRRPVEIEFDVPVGQEEEWMDRFAAIAIVQWTSRTLPLPCP